MVMSTIIFKDDLSKQEVEKIKSLCCELYNQNGKLSSITISETTIKCIDDTPVGALSFGNADIYQMGLAKFFKSWEYLDEEDESESGDLLYEYRKYTPNLEGTYYG